MGGDAFRFNSNRQNTDLVTKLPQGACVEVPAKPGLRRCGYCSSLPVFRLQKIMVDFLLDVYD